MPDDGFRQTPPRGDRLTRVETLLDEMRDSLRHLSEQVECLIANMHRQRGSRTVWQNFGVTVLTVCGGVVGAIATAIIGFFRHT